MYSYYSSFVSYLILITIVSQIQNTEVVIFMDRFLQTAEMLKPSTPSASHDSTGSSGSDDGAEYYPHIGDCLTLKHNI